MADHRRLPNVDPQAFQGLCELAAVICDTPMATAYLVDEHGRRHGAAHGGVPMDEPIAGTPCAVVFAHGAALAIADIEETGRFTGGLGDVRGYAAAPIWGTRGEPVGAVCVMDPRRREFDATQRAALAALARQAGAHVELSASHARLRAVVDGLSDSVLLTDGVDMVLVNEAYAKLVGLPPESAQQVTGPQVADAFERAFPNLAATLSGTIAAHEAGVPMTDEIDTGDGCIVARKYTPLEIDGRPGHLWQLRDVTEQRLAERRSATSEQRFAALAAAAPIGIVALDPDAELVFANSVSHHLFAMASGRPWHQALLEEDRPRVVAEWEAAVASRTPYVTRYRVRDADGEIREIDARVAAVVGPRDALLGYVGMFIDITDARATARALERSQVAEREERDRRVETEREARLQAEAARADLAARNEELLALAAAKDELVASVSHELRTPLTSIQAFVGMLEEDADLSADQHEAIEVIGRNAARLERVVGDLLSLKQVPEVDGIAREALDVGLIAGQAVAAARPRAERAGIDLAVDNGAAHLAWGDPERLPQALDCLVDNALKFTPAGGKVVLRVRQEGMRVFLDVQDTGAGVSGEEVRRIFEPFYRGDASRATGGGSGLGLAIANRLVGAQQGRITVSGGPGTGTTFTIELPAAGP